MTENGDGLAIRRDEKRQETLERISKEGLALFFANGYEATTLEDIAAAAGITKRTFFYYFKSKDEILLAAQSGGFTDALRASILEQNPDQPPMVVVRNSLSKLTSHYETKQSIVIDGLLQSTEALRARKQADFVDKENALFEVLCDLWPQPERRPALRLVAMNAMGVMRVAIEAWRQEGGKRPLTEHLLESFKTMTAEIQKTDS